MFVVWLETALAKEWLPHYSLARLPYFRTNTVVNRRFALCGRSGIV